MRFSHEGERRDKACQKSVSVRTTTIILFDSRVPPDRYDMTVPYGVPVPVYIIPYTRYLVP